MQPIPVCAVTAWSGTGKTTFLEKLVPALKMFGLRIAVVKHDGHDFDLDHPGKDSWRMTAAGADVTAIVSPFRAAIMENRSISMESVISNIQDVDLILIEGDNKEIGQSCCSTGKGQEGPLRRILKNVCWWFLIPRSVLPGLALHWMISMGSPGSFRSGRFARGPFK